MQHNALGQHAHSATITTSQCAYILKYVTQQFDSHGVHSTYRTVRLWKYTDVLLEVTMLKLYLDLPISCYISGLKWSDKPALYPKRILVVGWVVCYSHIQMYIK